MGATKYLAPCGLALLAAAVTGLHAAGARADSWHFDSAGRIQIDVHYDCARQTPAAALTTAGMTISASVTTPPLCVVEGWIPPGALSQIAAIPGVTEVKAPSYAMPRQPRTLTPNIGSASSLRAQKAQGATGIDGNGVAIMHADQFVAQTKTNGTGVTVGVQSTGVTSLSVIQGRGELPAGVTVLTPTGQASAPVGDEGTALLEEIHAVAPGAGLAFCGPTTFVQYISCVSQLVASGATVLVDDIFFPGEDVMSANSANAQAIGQILTQNPRVMLFTSVGNYTGSYWEGPYSPVATPQPLSCSGQVDRYAATVTLDLPQGGANFPLVLSWADPSGQNVSNFDLYWFQGATQVGCASAAGSTQAVIVAADQPGSQYISLSGGTYTVYIATPDASLANKFLKLWAGGDGLTTLSPSTPGAIISTQAVAPGAITIGAVNGSDGVGNTIEPFSSLGPLTLQFPVTQQVQAPVLVAPDGISVDAAQTYFQGFLFPDGNFYGTSAAVPNAGAVAALIQSAFPGFNAPDVLHALQTGAAAVGSGTLPDYTYGYGRVDAMGALGTIPGPTLTATLPDSAIDAGKSTASFPFTVSGTGPLHFLVTSSDGPVIPPSIVAAGSAGVTIAPSSCGATTLSCTLTVTAAQYGGTVNLVVEALDGANRTASATMKVTVNGPPEPPPQAVTPTPTPTPSSGGGGGGGALQGWALVCLALLALTPRRREARSTSRLRPHEALKATL